MGLVASVARAPSLHNSQPWRFRLRDNAIELHSDPERMIPEVDPARREMLISCGAALYGLCLGLRRLRLCTSYRPVVRFGATGFGAAHPAGHRPRRRPGPAEPG